MKVLILNFEYPPLGGGGGVATRQIAEALADRHDVCVITSAFEDLPRHEVVRGVTVYRVPVLARRNQATASLLSLLSFAPVAFIRGVAVLREKQYDLINAQFVVPSGLPAVLLSKLFRLPLVVSFIGGDIYDPTKGSSPHRHGLLRWLVRWIARHATAMTAISEDTKRRATELHGVEGDIAVTHLGIKPQDVQPVNRTAFELPAHKPLAVSIARLIPRKGFRTLIPLIKETPYDLVIVGDGPQRPELEELARTKGVHNRVHFLGFLSEEQKLQVLQLCDVYVSAAEHEGFGLVFLEAMQAGLPIVAFDNGGHVDFLNENNALLAPVSDTAVLRSMLLQLAMDEETRRRMAHNNSNKVKNFYLEKTTAEFEAVLAQAVTHKP